MNTEQMRKDTTEELYNEIFRKLGEDKNEALALYNALAGTECQNPDEIRVDRHSYYCSVSRQGGAAFSFSMGRDKYSE